MKAQYTDLGGSVVKFEIEYTKREDGTTGPPLTAEHDGNRLRYLGLADSRIFYAMDLQTKFPFEGFK